LAKIFILFLKLSQYWQSQRATNHLTHQTIFKKSEKPEKRKQYEKKCAQQITIENLPLYES